MESFPLSAPIESAMERMAKTIETTFLPVVASMDKKIDLDLTILRRVSELSSGIEEFKELAKSMEETRSNRDQPDD